MTTDAPSFQRKGLMRLTWPLLVVTVFALLGALGNQVMLLAVSPELNASIGAANRVFGVANDIAVLFSFGALVVIAQLLGGGALAAAQRASIVALRASTVLGIALALIAALGAPLFLEWLRTPDALRADATTYIWIAAAGVAFYAYQMAAFSVRRRVVESDPVDADDPAAPVDTATRHLLTTAPRITPRFYTVSGVDGAEVRLQVTGNAAWPQRAAAYLHRVQPGDTVRGWVLPHPHRVDRTRPGLAVVTGSGAAGVFAALRAGARGIHLVWGLGDKQLAPWMREELAAHLASGAVADVELAHAPQRVTDVLAAQLGEVRDRVARGEWIYVSGNDAMAGAVDALLHGALGAQRDHAYADLRYIVSA